MSFKIDDKVMPGFQFPFPGGNFKPPLDRNTQGTVIRVNGDDITVEWGPGERGIYKSYQLLPAQKI